MKVLIIASGEIESSRLREEYIDNEFNQIICADGGAKYAVENNIIPDVIIGDLDSLDEEIVRLCKKKSITINKYPTRKDKTDLELAVDYAVHNGSSEIVIMGAIGSRMDHTLGNILILHNLLKKNVKAKIVNNNNDISIATATDNVLVNKGNYKYLSIIPLFGGAVLTSCGLEYEVNNTNFEFGSTLGISNSIVKQDATLHIKKGTCIVIKSND